MEKRIVSFYLLVKSILPEDKSAYVVNNLCVDKFDVGNKIKCFIPRNPQDKPPITTVRTNPAKFKVTIEKKIYMTIVSVHSENFKWIMFVSITLIDFFRYIARSPSSPEAL